MLTIIPRETPTVTLIGPYKRRVCQLLIAITYQLVRTVEVTGVVVSSGLKSAHEP